MSVGFSVANVIDKANVASHMTRFSQSECFISTLCSYVRLKFIYVIASHSLKIVPYKNEKNFYFSKVMLAIQQGIDRANASAVSNAARVQRWTILPNDVSVAGGELGPTLKLKRFVFNKKYEEAIENLYN